MGRISILMVCVSMAVAVCGVAQVVNEGECGFNYLYEWYTPESNKKFLKILDEGRTGKCLEVKNTVAKSIPLVYTKSYQMELANDPIEISVCVKGKGAFRLAILPKSAEGECIYDNTGSGLIQVDSPDKWENKSHVFNFSLKNVLMAKNATFYLLWLTVEPGSDICFDDLKFKETSGAMILMKPPATSMDAPKTPTRVETQKTEPAKGLVKEIALSKLQDVRLKTYADEKPLVAPPPGNAVQPTAEGVELQYAFGSDRLDACMFEFDTDIGEFNNIAVTMVGDNSKFRPFLVLRDAGGESHYFPLSPSNAIAEQLINWSGKKTIERPVSVKNPFPANVYESRWGGDNNQTIDFPVKSVTLGLGKYPDATKGSGKVSFEKIVFSQK